MNILAINPFKNTNFNNVQPQTSQEPSFGLTMAAPLLKDTVSFRCTKLPSKKDMEKGAYLINEALSKKIRAKKAAPHERKKQLLMENFGDLIEQGIISFSDRLKGNRSIREKATTNGWDTMNLVLQHMDDISGFCFVLNVPKAFSEVCKRFKQLLQTRELEVTQAEYHRRAPKYRKNKIVESYDSLKPNDLQKLKSDINRIQNPTTQIWWDVDSRSGYSGLHSTLRTKDGETSELQIMTRNMEKVKKVENLLYKIRNGKSVDPKYEPVEKYLSALKPVDEFSSEAEKKLSIQLQTAMTKYTQQAYAQPLNNPFDTDFELLIVDRADTLSKKEKALIEKYSLDKIAILMEACEKIAK